MARIRKPRPKDYRVKAQVPAGAPETGAGVPPMRGEAIGVRELRDSFSERLRSVRAGTTLTVTDHGEPVAMLIPYGLPAGILRMLSEGTLTWSGSKDYPRPVPPVAQATAPATDWYQELKTEDDQALDAAIGASAADLRR